MSISHPIFYVIMAVMRCFSRAFSGNGSYRRSLTRPNKGIMGVIEVNGVPIALVKINFLAILSELTIFLPNL